MSIDKITGWFRVANSNPKFSDLSPIAEWLVALNTCFRRSTTGN